jgi:hypothetical protein
MKINESNFAFICFHLFFRIRTFQRVTADSNKKIASTGIRAAGCERGGSNSRSLSSRCRVASRLGF